MRRPIPIPRYVEPASVEIGDTIRVAWANGSVQHTRTAQVVSREYEGSTRVLLAGDGQEIMRWVPGHAAPRITLLSKAAALPSTLELFELEGLM